MMEAAETNGKARAARLEGGVMVRVVGVMGGALLMVGQVWSIAVWVELLGWMVLLWMAGSLSERRRWWGVVAMGAYAGLGYALPQMVMYRLPIAMAAVLIAALCVTMVLMMLGAGWMLRKASPWGVIGAGAVVVVVDWLNCTAVPIWGTAQSFVRSWSEYPRIIQFEAWTGMAGTMFVVVCGAGMVAGLFRMGLKRGRMLWGLAAMIFVAAGANWLAERGEKWGSLKVAAVGWDGEAVEKSGGVNDGEGFESLVAVPVRQALDWGAKLVVTPELGFICSNRLEDEAWYKWICARAKEYGAGFAVGYRDMKTRENRMVFVDADGERAGQYVKTHLTFFEPGTIGGDGELCMVEWGGVRIGGMICQDDNFTDLSCGYGRQGVAVMAVPTLDWQVVKWAHYQSSVHRAIESRYGMVRAAWNGVSAVIGQDGTVLGRMDHAVEGSGVVLGELELRRGGSLFNRWGDWFTAACGVYILGFAGVSVAARR